MCFGDSITYMAAVRADRSYPTILDEKLFADGYVVGNHGQSGGGFQVARDAYDTYYRDRGLWGACLLVGVNDISNGSSAETIYAGINSFVQLMVGDGLRVVLSTVLPWKNGGGWTSDKQGVTEDLNTQLLRLAGTNNRLVVIDGYSEFGDADDAELLARKFQEVTPDALHLGSYGGQTLAGLMYAAIKSFAVDDALRRLEATLDQMENRRRFRRAYGALNSSAESIVAEIRALT
jgi:hypothetical protein